MSPGAAGAAGDDGASPGRGGSTFLRIAGSGPPVIVVHGGPGFDHRYLADALLPLAARRRLIFYDQPGCGGTPRSGELSLASAAAHFAGLAADHAENGRIGVIAHSWGALLLLAAAAGAAPLPALSEGLLVNPVAPSRSAFDLASGRLRDRAPPEELRRFMELLLRGEGTAAMAVALPYYCARPLAHPPEMPLDAATYLEVVGGLGDFDFSTALPSLARLSVAVGSADFTGPDLAAPYFAACAHGEVMEGAGHFPFFEAPEAFAAVLGRSFG